ncbi:MAG: AMIN domain-containing protein [Campylobacterales bacterium]|nr:AMIN domain-containing protein [Campylobacterales bacterium]MBN2832961.1 AMIN domain-containing protein [Campylobacterales bacterium]
MRKIFWLFLSLIISIEARENPFETTNAPEVVGKTTQIEEKRIDFKSTSITLPSSARILKSVTLTFQNLDGSIEEEHQNIDQNIDWHHPLLLSPQGVEKSTPPPAAPIAPVPPLTKKNIEGKELKSVPSMPSVKTKSEERVKLAEGIFLFAEGNEIKIFTKDLKIRDFLIADPYKIVLDFKRTHSFATKTVDLKKNPFVLVTLGEHKDFYRIAILLDGHYRYDLQTFEGGYSIKLK